MAISVRSNACRGTGRDGGRGRKRKPAVAGAAGEAATATAEGDVDEDGAAEHDVSDNGASEITPVAENGAGVDDAPSNDPEGDWTYTPMSEWGSLDADEK